MKKTSKLVSIALVAVALSLSAAACSKKKKKEDPKPTQETANNQPADQMVAAKPAASTTTVAGYGGSVDALANFPADIKAVFGVNLKGLQKSKYAPMVKELMLKNDKSGNFTSFVKTCGFDPFEKLDALIVGVQSFDKDDDNRGSIVMKGAFGDEAALTGCAIKEAEKQGDKINVIEHKGKKLYEPAKEKKMAATFIAADTIVMGQVDWLKSLIDGGAANASSAPIAAQVGKVDSSKAIWFVIPELPAKAMGGPMAMMPAKPKGLWGALDFSAGLAVNMVVQMGSEAEATQAAAMAQRGAGMLKAFTTKMEMAATGDQLKIDLAMTEQQLEMAVDMAKSMVQRFGGHMGGGGMGMPPMPPGGP